jgi:hypothetical protein
MIKEALNAYAARAGRAFARDRQATVGASEVGKCARLVYFLKNEGDVGYHHDRDPDHVDGWGARERGKVYEDHVWFPAMRAQYGDKLLYAGPDQRTLVDGFLSATPDGLLVDQPSDALKYLGVSDCGSEIDLDCKTIDPRAALDGPKPEHVFQVQAQMGLFQALTNHKPRYAVLSYTDASFHDEVREFAVAFDAGVYAEAKRRARDVMLATKPEYLKPEGVIAGGKECKLCPFTASCGKIRADAVPANSGDIEVDQFAADSIAELGLMARSAKEESERKAAEARQLQDEIKAMLISVKRRRLEHGGIRVVWSPLKGRPSYDDKAIRQAAVAAGIDIEKFSRTGDPSDRMEITRTKIPASAGTSAAQAAS